MFHSKIKNMKKIFILLFIVVCSVGVYAQQNENHRLPYKLEKGSVTTELNFSPFSFNLNFDGEKLSTGPFAMPGLRIRVGLNNKWALRANVQLDFGHNKINENLDDIYENNYSKTVKTGTRIGKDNYTQFTFAPGFEYHFGNWERLSIYVGGEAILGFRVSQGSFEEDSREMLFHSDYFDEELKLVNTTETKTSLKTKNLDQTGKMFFGVNALAGFDFYVYKGLYLGAELGLGYTHSKVLKGSEKGKRETITTTPDGVTVNTENIDEVFDDKIAGGNLGFRCNPMIRLGWRF